VCEAVPEAWAHDCCEGCGGIGCLLATALLARWCGVREVDVKYLFKSMHHLVCW
jgi:hypothetical protein